MDSFEAMIQIEKLHDLADNLVKTPSKQPDWNKLDYSAHGVQSLFNEFREVAAWSDYLAAQLAPLLADRIPVYRALRFEELRIGFAIESELRENAKKWQLQSLASSERLLMAKINVADSEMAWQNVRTVLESFDQQVEIIRNRIKRLDDFRYAAQLLEKILNFAHALQEL